MFRKVRRIMRGLAIDCYNVCFNQVKGYVLMLHRIGPREPNRLSVIDELRVSEGFLQRFIDERKKRYEFISLDELYSRIKENNFGRRPFISFTFDDGFKDNLTVGLPFFEKNRIPFAVFVSTGFIDKRPAFNFPFLLERIIQANDSLNVFGKRFICQSQHEKNQVFRELKELILQLPYLSFESSFNTLFDGYLRDEFYEDLMLTWEDIRVLASSPLCIIGSHSVSHCRLCSVPLEFLTHELYDSKLQIETIIDKEVNYLSYPFGWSTDVSDIVMESAERFGYKMGFISYGGGIRNKDRNLLCVKREMLIDHE